MSLEALPARMNCCGETGCRARPESVAPARRTMRSSARRRSRTRRRPRLMIPRRRAPRGDVHLRAAAPSRFVSRRRPRTHGPTRQRARSASAAGSVRPRAVATAAEPCARSNSSPAMSACTRKCPDDVRPRYIVRCTQAAAVDAVAVMVLVEHDRRPGFVRRPHIRQHSRHGEVGVPPAVAHRPVGEHRRRADHDHASLHQAEIRSHRGSDRSASDSRESSVVTSPARVFGGSTSRTSGGMLRMARAAEEPVVGTVAVRRVEERGPRPRRSTPSESPRSSSPSNEARDHRRCARSSTAGALHAHPTPSPAQGPHPPSAAASNIGVHWDRPSRHLPSHSLGQFERHTRRHGPVE